MQFLHYIALKNLGAVLKREGSRVGVSLMGGLIFIVLLC